MFKKKFIYSFNLNSQRIYFEGQNVSRVSVFDMIYYV
jgi:hypothetical protein